MVSVHPCPECQADMYVYNSNRQLVYVCSRCRYREEIETFSCVE